VTELPFFATKVRLGRRGAEEVYQLGPLNEYEKYEESILPLDWLSFVGKRQSTKIFTVLPIFLTGWGWEGLKKSWQKAFRRGFPSSGNSFNPSKANYAELNE
jgi:hypothetical protein